SYQWSRRVQLVVNERVSSGYARQATVITEAKALFPNVLTRTNDASAAFSYEMSRRTQIQASLAYNNVLFDSSTQNQQLSETDAAVLRNGNAFSSRVAVSRLVTQADSIGVSQQFTQSVANGGRRSATNTLHATWHRPLATSLSLSAEGGI